MLLVRRAGIVLLIVALTLAVGGAVAGAKKKHKKKKPKSWSSSITLTHPGGTQFAGSVGSKLRACRDSRVVTLYYTDPNTGETRPLSVQRTDGKGNYRVNLTTPAYAGSYQAIVDARKVRAMKAKQTCKSATSASVQI
jgi:hypothetical protein